MNHGSNDTRGSQTALDKTLLIVYAAVFGVRNVTRKGDPITAAFSTSLYVTEPFVGTSIMQFVENGEIDLHAQSQTFGCELSLPII